MADDKESTLIKFLREATPFEAGLIAFLFLPPTLLIWLTIFGAVTSDKENPHLKVRLFIGVTVVYAIVVGIMVYGRARAENRRKEEEERQRRQQVAEEEERRRLEQERKNRIRELIRTSLRHHVHVWRNMYWIELESWVKAEEIENNLREMIEEGEVTRGVNEEHPEWGPIFALRSRL